MALAHPVQPIRNKYEYPLKPVGWMMFFFPDDLGSGPYTQFIIVYTPCFIAAF